MMSHLLSVSPCIVLDSLLLLLCSPFLRKQFFGVGHRPHILKLMMSRPESINQSKDWLFGRLGEKRRRKMKIETTEKEELFQ